MWTWGLAGASSKPPPPPCMTLVGKGASSLVGAFSHSAVLSGEQPDRDEERTSESVRSLAGKAQAVVGAGRVRDVALSVVLVKRDRPHVDVQLHSRHGCLWGSIHSSCF